MGPDGPYKSTVQGSGIPSCNQVCEIVILGAWILNDMETEYIVVIHVTCSSCIHISYEYSFCLPMFKNVRVLGLNEDFGHACAVHSQGITVQSLSV